MEGMEPSPISPRFKEEPMRKTLVTLFHSLNTAALSIVGVNILNDPALTGRAWFVTLGGVLTILHVQSLAHGQALR